MQLEFPSVTKLSTLAKCIAQLSKKRVGPVPSFNGQLGCVMNIHVHTQSQNPVLIHLADELVEYGLAQNGTYEVQLFKNVPFPYEMYPVLTISVAGSFKVTYDAIQYDKLMHHVIYNFGAYHKVSNTKYLHMAQRNIQVNGSIRSDIYTIPPADLHDYVVIKCTKFHDMAHTPGLEWIDPMLLPGVESQYDNIEIKRMTPGLIFDKANANTFVNTVRSMFPTSDIHVSAESPSRVMEKNKYLVGNIINYLKQNRV